MKLWNPKQTKAVDFSFSLHYLGNPSFERSVPKPVIADIPTEIEHGTERWMMPHGGAALEAVRAMLAGGDVEAKLVELGGVKL